MSSLSVFVCGLVLLLTLLVFFIISLISIRRNKVSFEYTWIQCYEDRNYHHSPLQSKNKTAEDERDAFLSARNSQPWWSVGLSFYAAGMGSWLLFAPPETGFLAGWIGSIAYGISNASPFWIMIWLGPKVKSALGRGSRGYTVVDFVRERYGRNIQIVVSAASLFFMFIFLSAELTSIGGVLSSISDGYPPIAAIIPVSFVTVTYIVFGGAPTSISTDRIQGVALLVLGALAVGVVASSILPEVQPEALAEASKPTITVSDGRKRERW